MIKYPYIRGTLIGIKEKPNNQKYAINLLGTSDIVDLLDAIAKEYPQFRDEIKILNEKLSKSKKYVTICYKSHVNYDFNNFENLEDC